MLSTTPLLFVSYQYRIKAIMNNEHHVIISHRSIAMTYQIVLLDGNNVSYRVANIATTTTHWLQEQHLLAASSSSFISCRPKATTNGKEEMSASAPFHNISHRAMATTSTQFIILYRTVAITTMRRAIAATLTFIISYHTVTTISIVSISY